MKPNNSKLIILPDNLNQVCEEFAMHVVASYRRGEKNQSLSYSTHGMQANASGWAISKKAECAGCLFLGLDPLMHLDWRAWQADRGHDVIWHSIKIDIKQTGPNSRFLMWPANKVPLYVDKDFDVFLLVKSAAPNFCMAGWIGKAQFACQRRVAPAGFKIDAGNWYMDQAELWSCDDFLQTNPVSHVAVRLGYASEYIRGYWPFPLPMAMALPEAG